MVSIDTSGQDGPRFDSQVWEFTCSPSVCMGFLWVLRFIFHSPKTCISRSFGDFTLPLGLTVRVHGWMDILKLLDGNQKLEPYVLQLR